MSRKIGGGRSGGEGRCPNLRLLRYGNRRSWWYALAGLGKEARRVRLSRGFVSYRVSGGNRKEKYIYLLAHEVFNKRISLFNG